MKNLLNLNGLYDSSPNQTGETQSRQNRTVVKPWSSRGQAVLTLLLFFLTLGVGQAWANYAYLDLTGTTWWYNDNAAFRLDKNGTGNVDSYTEISNSGVWRFDIGDYTGAATFKRMNSGRTNQWNYANVTIGSSNVFHTENDNGVTTRTTFVINYIHGTNYIYFDNSVSNFSGNLYFVIGHDYSPSGSSSTYSTAYKMTQLTGTKLWYVKITDTWEDATYYAVVANSGTISSTDHSWGSSSLSTKGNNGYTAAYKTVYNMEGGSFLLTPASSGNNKAMTITYYSGYSNIPTNSMTATVRTKVAGGTYGDSFYSPTTVTVQTRYLSNNGTSNTQSANVSTSAKTASKADVTTGEVNYSYTALAADAQWQFDGWGTSNSTVSSTNSTYQIAAGSTASKTATTIYAFFTRKPLLTVNKGTNGSSASGTASNNAKTSWNITATPNTGYSFNKWTTNSGTVTYGNANSASTTATISADATITASYTENLTDITITTDGHGTITTPASLSNPYNLGVATMQNIDASPNTGYVWNKWNISGNAALNSSATTKSNKAKGNGTAGGTGTITATFTPITYTIHFNANGGTGEMSNQTVTYDASTNLTANAFTKTGYNFAGWATSTENATAGTIARTDGAAHGNLSSTQGATVNLYAVWTPKQSALTLDPQTSATGHGADGTATASASATYGAAMPSLTGSLPTAADGYAFMGFFDAIGGAGTKYYNADGTSAHVWDKDITTGTTLYAYYKKAQITALTFDAAVVAPNGEVGVTPTVAPRPTGTNSICWKLLYSNGNLYSPQPAFSPTDISNKVTFDAPSTSGTYLIAAVLRTGNECNGGTKLDSVTSSFQVAGDHNVTVQYKCGSEVIAPSTTVTGRPLVWTEVVAHEIFGYTFSGWTAGDGITLEAAESGRLEDLQEEDPTIVAVTKMKAIYDGRLTANYTQKNIIYFKNTLGWNDVYVNLYPNAWWNNPKGAGNKNLADDKRNKHMERLGETDIWYYDYGNISPSLYVSFTSSSQNGSEYFWLANPGVNVVYPANYQDDIHTDKSSENGFKAATPMFVPLAGQEATVLNQGGSPAGKANYYNRGYWTKYTAGTGYTLEIYNDSGDSIKSIEFTSADDLMPMQVVTDLEAGKTYKYQIRRGGTRSNGIYYGNTGTMTYANHGQDIAWDLTNTMAGGFSMASITTNAAGDYTFNLSYSGDKSTPVKYRLRMEVDYPIADGDYRLVYSDGVQTKALVSKIVTKVNNGKDTVSFFIRPDRTPVLKIQKSTINSATGAITWAEYPMPGTPTNQLTGSALTKDSVYNICLQMNGEGAISVEKIEAYTGNYYIRTDAANSGWDNYRAADHLMTYSEYSETYSDFTHYFVAHVESGKNVKFVVANDYSPNISDTLEISTYRGGDSDHINSGGYIKANANVRFMWDRRKNAVYRAYLDEAKSEGSKFLVLRANSSDDLKDENGNNLINSAIEGQAGYNHKAPDNSIQFVDNENWIYETNVMVKPSAYVKLYGHFNGKDFYFKGESGNVFDGADGDGNGIANAIQLMTGDGSLQKVRVIYDFKTDRLLAAWMPSGEINSEHEINADVMFIREGQGDINQLVFVKENLDGEYGSITAIKSAYGVMRFNKWTLNNKSKEGGHAVLGDPKSVYERSLFWISFPFKVKLSEVFGFGTYGTHWAIQKYNGERRAAEGFWAESRGFWEWMDRNTEYLEPDQGYLLAIDLDLLGESASVWNNGVENVELYFPSYGTMPDITHADVVHTLPSYPCTIDWSKDGLLDTGNASTSYNRTIFDSHWNVMSVPTYVNTSNIAFANTIWTTTIGSNFLYTWNPDDNTLTPTAGAGYHYHAMHAYMVQYHGNVTWSASSGSPYSSIVARRTYADQPEKLNLCLEIRQNEKMIDRTYVVLSNDEEVSETFQFGEDMTKEFNARKANICTYVEGMTVAGNTMPMSEQTTIVPVGAYIKSAGDYTFAIPEGTNGVGVTLIDNETGVRTSLSALDYTVNLEPGTYDSRFLLEISPVQNTPTDLGNVQGDNVQGTKVRKVLIDGILYIVKDGKMFDARGTLVRWHAE